MWARFFHLFWLGCSPCTCALSRAPPGTPIPPRRHKPHSRRLGICACLTFTSTQRAGNEDRDRLDSFKVSPRCAIARRKHLPREILRMPRPPLSDRPIFFWTVLVSAKLRTTISLVGRVSTNSSVQKQRKSSPLETSCRIGREILSRNARPIRLPDAYCYVRDIRSLHPPDFRTLPSEGPLVTLIMLLTRNPLPKGNKAKRARGVGRRSDRHHLQPKNEGAKNISKSQGSLTSGTACSIALIYLCLITRRSGITHQDLSHLVENVFSIIRWRAHSSQRYLRHGNRTLSRAATAATYGVCLRSATINVANLSRLIPAEKNQDSLAISTLLYDLAAIRSSLDG